jgi:hypothetical protein
MHKISLVVLLSFAAATAASAQTAGMGITTSTDPAKIAAVERHAQDLKSRQVAPTKATSAVHRTAGAKHRARTHQTTHAKPKVSSVHANSAKP